MIKKVILTLGIIITVILLAWGLKTGYYILFMDPYRGTVKDFSGSKDLNTVLKKNEIKQDLAYLYTHLKERHPAWLDGSKHLVESVKTQYEKELANIENINTVLELWQASARIVATMHDGHTWVDWYSKNSLYIDDFNQINSLGKPVKINNIPCERLLEIYKTHSSYELDFYAESKFYNQIINEHYLRLCGVDTSNGVNMVFTTENGQKTYNYSFVPLENVKGYNKNKGDQKWVYYTIDNEKNAGIFTLKTCIVDKEYLNTLDNFFSEVFKNSITNVIVDLRYNGGGNSQVADEFLKYINVESYSSWDCAVRQGGLLQKYTDIIRINKKKDTLYDGNIYILTNSFTFSSAMDFTMLINDNKLGTVVGETPGNLPDSYGDSLYFEMPHSKLCMRISYKRWYRVDKTLSGKPIIPHYEVPSADALDKVYELINKNTLK